MRLNHLPPTLKALSIGKKQRRSEREKATRGGLKLWSSSEKLLHGALHSRLSFISHSKPGARSVTLINRPARNTNQYCRGIINPLCSQSPLQKVKLKLIEITFCWLIVALSRVKEEVG